MPTLAAHLELTKPRISAPVVLTAGAGPWAAAMVRLVRTVGQRIAQDLLDLVERAMAPEASGLLQLKPPARFFPPGFLPLAAAGLLFIAAAGVRESIRQHGGSTPRADTHLSITKIAVASRSGVTSRP